MGSGFGVGDGEGGSPAPVGAGGRRPLAARPLFNGSARAPHFPFSSPSGAKAAHATSYPRCPHPGASPDHTIARPVRAWKPALSLNWALPLKLLGALSAIKRTQTEVAPWSFFSSVLQSPAQPSAALASLSSPHPAMELSPVLRLGVAPTTQVRGVGRARGGACFISFPARRPGQKQGARAFSPIALRTACPSPGSRIPRPATPLYC